MRLLIASLPAIALLALPAAAPAATEGGSPVEEAVRALGSSPVHVAPGASPPVTPAQVARIRRAIAASGAGAVYVAVLAPSAAVDAGAGTAELVRDVATGLRRPGTYVVVTGRRLHTGSTLLPGGLAGELGAAAVTARGGQGVAAVLLDFVRRLGAARRGFASAGQRDGGGGVGAAPLLAGGAIVVVALALLRRQRVRRRGEARRAARARPGDQPGPEPGRRRG